MTVTRITGRGELFDRGDPVPKHVAIKVEGPEGPLVERLRLKELLSAALAERVRRSSDQASRLDQFWLEAPSIILVREILLCQPPSVNLIYCCSK